MNLIYPLYSVVMLMLTVFAMNNFITGPSLIAMLALATLRATARHIRFYSDGRMAHLIIRLPAKMFLFFYFLGQNP